ncbi:MAG: hypothetical protein ACR2P2_00875 [Nakamurella sp.]
MFSSLAPERPWMHCTSSFDGRVLIAPSDALARGYDEVVHQ